MFLVLSPVFLERQGLRTWRQANSYLCVNQTILEKIKIWILKARPGINTEIFGGWG